MTRRQKICSLLIGYLGNISVANGYLTAAGADIRHWGTQIVVRDKTSAMNIDVKDTTNSHEMGHRETLTFEFELSCKKADNHTTILNMVQDVQKCLEDNLTALETAMTDNGMRWYAESEDVSIERDGEAEYGKAKVVMNLLHRITEKWELDETVY